jgi:cytochrome P450
MTAADLSTMDLLDPAFYASGRAHEVWAAMRAHAPLHRQPLPGGGQLWSVTRYRDACRVLANHREFTSERGTLLNQLGRGEVAAGRMLVAADPPRHDELRRPLNRLFAPRSLARSEDAVRRAVRRVLAPARDGGEWDLAEAVAQLPVAVAGGLLGLPEADWPRLSRWTSMAAAPDDPAFLVRSSHATLAIAHHSLFDYFAQQIRARENGGGDGEDLVSYLMTMRAGEGPLTREEIVVNCYSVLLGANATTPHTVAGTVLALTANGGRYWRADLADDPDRITALVEEGLRWTSPAMSFLRHAVCDVEIGGGTVPAGDPVAVWVASANRDGEVFTDADRFDITRTYNPHIAFGFGPHYCLGAGLARLTLRVFFTEVLRSIGAVELAGPPVYLRSTFVAGLARLPVRTPTSPR